MRGDHLYVPDESQFRLLREEKMIGRTEKEVKTILKSISNYAIYFAKYHKIDARNIFSICNHAGIHMTCIIQE